MDSLKIVLSKQKVDTNRVNTLVAITMGLAQSSPDEAIKYGTEASVLANKLQYKKAEALALKFTGMAYYFQSKFVETLDYWLRAMAVFKAMRDKAGEANILNNIGSVYFNQSDDAKALSYSLQSLHIAEQIKDTLRIASALTNIGNVYINKKATYGKALDYLSRALPLLEKLDNKQSMVIASSNLGEVYFNRNRFDSALYYYKKSLQATENKDEAYTNSALTNIGKVYAKMGNFNQAVQYQQRALDLAKKLKATLYISKSHLALADTYKDNGDVKTSLDHYNEAAKTAKEVHAYYELKDAYAGLSASYAALGDYDKAYNYQALFSNFKDTLYNLETDKKLGSLQFDFDLQKKQGEINLLVKDKKLSEVELKRQRFVRLALIIGLFLILIIAFAIYRNYRIKVKSNRILDRQKDEIEHLLLNILPVEVAKELQTTGNSTPRNYESVSVLFTDFKGFTTIADKMSPDELVKELNTCFIAFDNIIEKYELEKIKTIGDSYMCAGGIPTPTIDHPYKIVKAGMEILDYVRNNNEKRVSLGLERWDIRIGIHVGPLVAGVVGKKKYAYDIWGSTVNIASRMESNGDPASVNISAATYELIRDKFYCRHRGKIFAKNVGEVDMYFVEGEMNNNQGTEESTRDSTPVLQVV